MKGYAVAIRRDDGSVFFASPVNGFATPVWFMHCDALVHARQCREHNLDAVVVSVEYTDPTITGPSRFIKESSNAS